MTASALLNALAVAGVVAMAAVAPAPAEPTPAAAYGCFVRPNEAVISMGPYGPYIGPAQHWLRCDQTQLAWAWRST